MGLVDQNPDESNLSPETAPYLFIDYTQSTGLALQWWIFEQGWEPTDVVLSLIFQPNQLQVGLAEWSEKLEWISKKTKKISLPSSGVLWIYADMESKTLFFGTGTKVNTQSQLGKIRMPMEWISENSTPFLTSVMVNPPEEYGGLTDPSLSGEIRTIMAGNTPMWINRASSKDSPDLQKWWWVIPALFFLVVVASFLLRKR